MRRPYVFIVVAVFVVISFIGGYFAARPAEVSLAAQSQFEQVTESLAGLWQKIGANIFPAGLDWNMGIGTKTPSEKLSVVGTIESMSGGFKFPDGTIQQTAQLVGPQGPPGITGAGNIAFIHDGSEVLLNDGTAWYWSGAQWIAKPENNAPIPASDIVQWVWLYFLDKNGDVWVYLGSGPGYVNIGHP